MISSLTSSNMRQIQKKLKTVNVHLNSLRNLKSLNRFVNTVNNGGKVDFSSKETEGLRVMYDYYVHDKKLLKIDDKEMELGEKYMYLLHFISRMRSNFKDIFRNTVEKTPGMRVYLLTNVVFDKNDNKSRDWLVSFMIEYLTPTADDFNVLTEMCSIPKEIEEQFGSMRVERVPEFYDETYTLIGMWRRDINDWITEPINTIDTKNLPTKFVKKIDVAKIIAEAGIISCKKVETPQCEEDPMDELPF